MTKAKRSLTTIFSVVIFLSTFTTSFAQICQSDFFSVSAAGDIQGWHLSNGTITGGDTILSGAVSSLSYNVFEGNLTFVSTFFPYNDILYYDYAAMDWIEVPTDIPILNNAGHGEALYFTGEGNRSIYYYQDGNLILLDTFIEANFAVADLAVDEEGQAWAFYSPNNNNIVSELRVYDSSGLLTAYPISFTAAHCYGAMIVRDTIYIGVGIPTNSPELVAGSLQPVYINGNEAELGEPILQYNDAWEAIAKIDLASCAIEGISTSTTALESNNSFHIFPNPTNGLLNLQSDTFIKNISLFNSIGQIAPFEWNGDQLDLSPTPAGIYLLVIELGDTLISRRLIKH